MIMKKLKLFICSMLLVFVSNAQIISTIAGQDKFTRGYNGDNIIATSALLNAPDGVAVDPSGNVYIADTYNFRIRKINVSDGIISTVAGNGKEEYSGDGGLATSAGVYYPTGVAVDAYGNIYIADYNYCVIRKVTASTGIISTVAGNGTLGFSGDGSFATWARLANPFAIAVDALGNIYIADQNNNRIRKVNASNRVISTVAGNGTAGYGGDGGLAISAMLNTPVGVAVDVSGNIYIVDQNNYRIRKVTTNTGIISTVAGNGLDGTNNKNIFVEGAAATSTPLGSAYGIAIDASTNIYISMNHYASSSSTFGSCIQKVNAANGIINIVAGNGSYGQSGDGGQATLASICNPIGVALDAYSNIYIDDFGNNCIRKVTMTNTDIKTLNSNKTKLITGKSSIRAEFDGNARIEICSLSGLLLRQAQATNTFIVDNLKTGLYIVKINGAAYKVVVR